LIKICAALPDLLENLIGEKDPDWVRLLTTVDGLFTQ